MRVPRATGQRRAGLEPGLLALALLLLAAAAPMALGAESFQGRVVGVTDGDTLTVLRAGRATVIRLHGIDAPERGQPFSRVARQHASNLAFDARVTVLVRDRDRYGRLVAEVVLPDGRSLNQALVRAGYAWWYRRYSADYRLATAEDEARAAHAGLWRDSRPVPPWEWRRTHRLRGVPGQ